MLNVDTIIELVHIICKFIKWNHILHKMLFNKIANLPIYCMLYSYFVQYTSLAKTRQETSGTDFN